MRCLEVVHTDICSEVCALSLPKLSRIGWVSRSWSTNSTVTFRSDRYPTGRLRPDFLDRCKWDKTLKACAGYVSSLSQGHGTDDLCRKVEAVIDGRRSFPSGHSSTAFAGMTFLSLWLAGITGAWCLSQPVPGGSFLGSKLARLTLSLLPLAFATWVAVSRVEDYVGTPLSHNLAVSLTRSACPAATSQGGCDRRQPHRHRLRNHLLPDILAKPILLPATHRPSCVWRPGSRPCSDKTPKSGAIRVRADGSGKRACRAECMIPRKENRNSPRCDVAIFLRADSMLSCADCGL